MNFWKTLKASLSRIDADQDWTQFSTEELVKILKREKGTEACLGLDAGNRIVAEILGRLVQQKDKQ